jgi:selenocysteine lyase/cysteine desulfurase
MTMADRTQELDMKAVRGNFPALDKGQVFFDNAGGSQTLGTAIDAYVQYLATDCRV